ncbi:unnamed protein product [Brucella canis str. Oliveri]|nr:unnamed protein product [Brucella canis str. Oliveri]
MVLSFSRPSRIFIMVCLTLVFSWRQVFSGKAAQKRRHSSSGY